MERQRTPGIWLPMLAVSLFCTLIGFTVLTSGCSKFRKKEKAEFEPGKGWLGDMRGRIEKTIGDPDRKIQMLGLVDRIEMDLRDLDGVVQDHYGALLAVDTDYNATREDFQRVHDEFNAKRREFRDRLMEARFAMRDLATPAEWKKLSKAAGKGLLIDSRRLPGE